MTDQDASALGFPDEVSVSSGDIISSLDRELDFFRRSIFTVSTTAITFLALSIVGYIRYPIEPAIFGSFVYSTVLIGIMFLGNRLISGYQRRAHFVRKSKIELVKNAGYVNVFPQPAGSWAAESHTSTYKLAILLGVLLGFVIIWFPYTR